MGLILKPFCSSSRSKMSRGRGSPKWRLGHQDNYKLTEVLSQVVLHIPPAPTGQRSSGLIQVKSGLNCQMLTAGCWKGQRSDKGFGKRNGFFNFVLLFEKYTFCRNPISHGESCLNNTGWGGDATGNWWYWRASRFARQSFKISHEWVVLPCQSLVFFLVVAGTCLNLS